MKSPLSLSAFIAPALVVILTIALVFSISLNRRTLGANPSNPICGYGDSQDRLFSFPLTANLVDQSRNSVKANLNTSSSTALSGGLTLGSSLTFETPENSSPCSANFTLMFDVKATEPGQIIDASNGTMSTFTNGLGVTIAEGNEVCNSGTTKALAGQIYFNFAGDGQRAEGFCSSQTVTDGQWHTVFIIVHRTSDVEMYVSSNSTPSTIDDYVASGMMTHQGGLITFPQVIIGSGHWMKASRGQLRNVTLYTSDVSPETYYATTQS